MQAQGLICQTLWSFITHAAMASGQVCDPLSSLHESLLLSVLGQLPLAARLRASGCCRAVKEAVDANPAFVWGTVEAQSLAGVRPALLWALLQKSRGWVKSLEMGDGSRESAAAESSARFSEGLRAWDLSPFTRGQCAVALASLLPRLEELVLDEETSCIGGLTDDLCIALAHMCCGLRRLEVRFARGLLDAMAAEAFTDQGLIALSEQCSNLRVLVLQNCSSVTDRALYALAANCHHLQELHIGGYSERISDNGMTVLLPALQRGLTRLELSSKLYKITDASIFAVLGLPAPAGASLAGDASSRGVFGSLPGGFTSNTTSPSAAPHAGAPQLARLKFTSSMTDASLAALAARHPSSAARSPLELPVGYAPSLRELNLRKCANITAGGVIDLLASGTCSKLQRLLVSGQVAATLPQQVYVSPYWQCILEVRKVHRRSKGPASIHPHAEVRVEYRQRG